MKRGWIRQRARFVSGLAAALAAIWGAGCVKAVCGPLILAEKPLTPADAIVVLGYGPALDKHGKPNPELVRRVTRGVEIYRQGVAPVVIMTGGFTSGPRSEADVMREAAVGLGVPSEAVILEEEAQDTIGNARYSARIMKDKGWTRAIVVSSPSHLKRAKRLFEAAGLEVQTTASAPGSAAYSAAACVYEYGAAAQYLFKDVESQVRDGEERKKP